MRAAALLLAVGVTIVSADQAPPRATPQSAGPPGEVNPPTAKPLAATPAADPISAVIRGRVVRADNGQPIEGARVGNASAGSAIAISDADGRFELTKLRAGTYTLAAYASGYPVVGFGSRGFGDSRPITVAPGQIVNGVDFAVPRGAVLAGVVLDEHGEPLPLAAVWVLRQRFVNGERRLVQATESDPTSGVVTGGDITDDLGRFRIYGLRPGTTYYLAGRQPAAGAVARTTTSVRDYDLSAPALYPTGGSFAEAQPLTFAPGQEISGLSFSVRPRPTATITVSMSGPNGAQRGTFSYRQPDGSEYPTNTTSVDGRYSISRRPPGTYTFFARDDAGLVGVARVELNGEDVVVPLTMKPGWVLRGRVVTDEESLVGLPANVTVSGRLLQPGRGVATPAKPDGSFELTGLVGPIHLMTSAAGWFTKQVLVGGRDVTGLPLNTSRDIDDVQVVITQRVTGLSGTIRDDKGRPAADAYMVVFPEDPEKRWAGSPYVRAARAGADGQFTLRGMPPGRYRAVAVAFLESGDETNPDLITQLDHVSMPVTLAGGVTPTLDLRLAPWP
jgi:protocatechuate 3,4-dioxygenase beta subunit